ncbi:MAG TPA: hypothetical protein PLX73_00700 [Candidatus Paceibacterota bacterium]|nr:hypothetical protein [Candidatus Paceibacterota bacterium]
MTIEKNAQNDDKKSQRSKIKDQKNNDRKKSKIKKNIAEILRKAQNDFLLYCHPERSEGSHVQ